ncbi:choice-of-anchor P family protein [Actinokineospora sp. HUAS TT18]|uniref:choice-of-anchor P family protein n=1 Tax=Actinokineospora sp. HUAS TT18 TaxID=3447451 RepID=UPI003F520506
MQMRLARRGAAIGVAAAAALLLGATPASAAPGDGSAYVADVAVTLLGAPAVKVGPLAPSKTSGPTSAQLASINVPGIVSAGLVTSSATRDDATGVVHSKATLADVGLTLAGLGTIKAINVDCDASQAGIVGSTQLVDVKLLGVSVPVNPAPNTVITLPLVTITFNEQIDNADGGKTVNGVHVKLNILLGAGDVVLGSATCGPAAPPIPLASGAGLWIGLGIVGLAAIPVGITVIRKRQRPAAV